MDLSDLISADSVIALLPGTSKKQVMQELSRRIAGCIGIEESAIFQTLMQREKLGSTGVGNGVAIPHGRIAGLPVISGFFARLAQPVDFEAIDDAPVDLLFVLLAPEAAGADHLKALARVSRLIRDPQNLERLRATSDGKALFSILSNATPHAA